VGEGVGWGCFRVLTPLSFEPTCADATKSLPSQPTYAPSTSAGSIRQQETSARSMKGKFPYTIHLGRVRGRSRNGLQDRRGCARFLGPIVPRCLRWRPPFDRGVSLVISVSAGGSLPPGDGEPAYAHLVRSAFANLPPRTPGLTVSSCRETRWFRRCRSFLLPLWGGCTIRPVRGASRNGLHRGLSSVWNVFLCFFCVGGLVGRNDDRGCVPALTPAAPWGRRPGGKRTSVSNRSMFRPYVRGSAVPLKQWH